MSDAALAAWDRNYRSRQLELTRNDPEPFRPGRRLGGGGIGIVHETKLDGISLALKRTYARKLTDHQLNEIKILSQISKKRHKHIVELIGSYIHRQKGVYELGLLIWPVATCDIATFLHAIGCLGISLFTMTPSVEIREEELYAAAETLAALVGIPWMTPTNDCDGKWYLDRIRISSWKRLYSSFGCTATAVAWLHDQGIRHKDLKPSQVLLSPHGLWLTDFGWSKDMSELTASTTSGGDNITLKYQAPERAERRPCGHPEDIFALGCIFLEMMELFFFMTNNTPWKEKGWSFHANIGQIETWLEQPAIDFLYPSLAPLIRQMVSYEPRDRPKIQEVVTALSEVTEGMSFGESFFGTCCKPARVLTQSDTAKASPVQASSNGLTHREEPLRSPRVIAPPDDQRKSSRSTTQLQPSSLQDIVMVDRHYNGSAARYFPTSDQADQPVGAEMNGQLDMGDTYAPIVGQSTAYHPSQLLAPTYGQYITFFDDPNASIPFPTNHGTWGEQFQLFEPIEETDEHEAGLDPISRPQPHPFMFYNMAIPTVSPLHNTTTADFEETSMDIVQCEREGCTARYTGIYRKRNLARHMREKHILLPR
ncbi:kinase-like protein [Dothidotthia symphoricarpi CBS 119687]|uniref:Kinase-like protein n=1 Tax=Dothidotthia symphoricarpi CBS 119687 TaxID=1392245 RepID=A0A6A6A4Q2_9PLEO|nr:kinase-like protein [Dothidotthia symphoricarpi CBS 119687]KAF2125571.1 kinase-like protein [Dothidotthia symphoricarpi CBS 119687]